MGNGDRDLSFDRLNVFAFPCDGHFFHFPLFFQWASLISDFIRLLFACDKRKKEPCLIDMIEVLCTNSLFIIIWLMSDVLVHTTH